MRFALLAWPLGESEIEALCERLRAPSDVRELALTVCRTRPLLQGAAPESFLELLKRADAFRRPERFGDVLEVVRLAAPAIDTARIERARVAAAGIDAGKIAARASSPAAIPQLVDAARLEAIRALG